MTLHNTSLRDAICENWPFSTIIVECNFCDRRIESLDPCREFGSPELAYALTATRIESHVERTNHRSFDIDLRPTRVVREIETDITVGDVE